MQARALSAADGSVVFERAWDLGELDMLGLSAAEEEGAHPAAGEAGRQTAQARVRAVP